MTIENRNSSIYTIERIVDGDNSTIEAAGKNLLNYK